MNAPLTPQESVTASAEKLGSVLREMSQVAVAVSGGVDSLTLATFAHRLLGDRVSMYHAVSPAVPPTATQRTRSLAAQEGWQLRVVDAGEFASEDYVRNPSNRCYFCKTSLYGTVSRYTQAQVVSGTNVDDLGDYRPGLNAAKEHAVRHPFVEVAMTKKAVRALARELGLPEIADLPSSPCLSSRVETGIAIDSKILRAVDQVEQYLKSTLPVLGIQSQNIRCRFRLRGIVIEVDKAALAILSDSQRASLATEIRDAFAVCAPDAAVMFEPYKLGSAFLHPINLVR